MYRISMTGSTIRNASVRLTLLCALSAIALTGACAWSQGDKPAPSGDKPAADKAAADKAALPPLPADAHVQQQIQLDGKPLKYTVTVGSLPVRDKDGKAAGDVVVTAYTVEGDNRPVTFAFNGGPGASSVYLNFGAIGPKHMNAGNEGDSPSDPGHARLTIPAPGSTSPTSSSSIPSAPASAARLVPEDQAKKLFYSTTPDIQYLSRIIYDWLVKNGRLGSRRSISSAKATAAFAAPASPTICSRSSAWRMNGVVLVSPYLNPDENSNGDLSPLPWMMTLPSITAAHLEREKKLTPEAMADVIAYTRGEYATALLKGRSDPDADAEKMIQRVTEMTGLDPAVRQVLRRPHRDRRLSARGPSRRRQARLRLRLQRHLVRSLSLRARAARQRSHPRQHHRAAHHRHGRLRDPHRRLEDRCPLQRACRTK